MNIILEGLYSRRSLLQHWRLMLCLCWQGHQWQNNNTKHTYFRWLTGAAEGFEDSRCFPRTSLLNVLIGEGKFSKDLRITKELSVADWQWWTHMDWRSSKNLPPLHCCVSTEPAFPVYLISLSMCVHVRVEVLDISIIGLAIGGLVHMLPPSLSSHNHTTICVHMRLTKAEVGFDCQLYVTAHSPLFRWIRLPSFVTIIITSQHIQNLQIVQ